MIRAVLLCACLLVAGAAAVEAAEGDLAIEPRMVHLRSGEAREWSSFPATADGRELSRKFTATKNDREAALWLRQQDVKQDWQVLLNGKRLGKLIADENDQTICLPVPAAGLVDGENVLKIAGPAGKLPPADDIRVGQIRLERRPVAEALRDAILEIDVRDVDTGRPTPCRLTIVNDAGSLQATSAVSLEHLAVRPGVIYTSRGTARFGLPAGKYTIYAGRGFEYSLARLELTLQRGDDVRKPLEIRREAPTAGYVACDPHVHTLTFAGHGDATIDERMITLAGEGIELPIATDHNVHIDCERHARRLGVRQFFTPVIGNEVTTPTGHFCVFPIKTGADVPAHKQSEWAKTFDAIFGTPGVKIAILNHARDIHSGTRPLGPKLHNALVGENLEGWPARYNGMEVVNSGATQSDPLQLTRDWMGLLNRGRTVTPVGSSDSHDVSRYIVGQGRTYIRCDDRDVSKLDVAAAVESFLAGRVMVSYGLLAEMTVDGKHGPGELVQPGDEIEVGLRVLGPHWVTAERVQLYANGKLLREVEIASPPERDLPRGVLWRGTWKIPKPKHDVHLTAVALGTGIDGLYWPTAKPYQPTSPEWKSRTLGVTGPVWIDADGDGRRTCARDYAERAIAAGGKEIKSLVAALETYDEAVAAQAAHLYRSGGGSVESRDYEAAITAAAPQVRAGFRSYERAWRETEIAKTTP